MEAERREGRTLLLRDNHEGLPTWRSEQLRQDGRKLALRGDRAVCRADGRDAAHQAEIVLR